MGASPHTATHAETVAFLKLPKLIRGDVEWVNTPDESAFYRAYFILEDERGVSIPGYTIELYYRRGRLRQRCKFMFSVFSLRDNGLRNVRVYQLEVVPSDESKHTEDGVRWYGPHAHIGDKGEQPQGMDDKGCEHHEAWFRYFLVRCNITHRGAYNDPDPPSPQLELGYDNGV